MCIQHSFKKSWFGSYLNTFVVFLSLFLVACDEDSTSNMDSSSNQMNMDLDQMLSLNAPNPDALIEDMSIQR